MGLCCKAFTRINGGTFDFVNSNPLADSVLPQNVIGSTGEKVH